VRDSISLTCPNCGGRLEITGDVNRFACAHCGCEQIVHRSEGVVSTKPVVDGLYEVKLGVDRAASELAIRRLREELEELESRKSTLKAPGDKPSGRKPSPGCVLSLSLIDGALAIAIFAAFALIPESSMPSEFRALLIGLGAFFAFFAVVFLFLWILSRSRQTTDRAWQEWEALQAEIAAKREEIARHLGIVSSQ
jgi:hypothetical protein